MPNTRSRAVSRPLTGVDRALVPLGAFAIALALAPAAPALTQDYPTKPIRLVIPFTAGSATDLLARRVSAKMSENWGQQVVVDNRRGGGGTLVSGIVAKAAPNGYTLLVHSIAFALNAALYSKIKKQMQAQGEEGRASMPEQFATFVRAEIDKIGTIVKQAGVRIE
jgi:tripartite-type tricarboxylate transporter receptor subunit TctC